MLVPDGVKIPSVFMSCEHPVVVDTPNGRISVPCGKCALCLDNKAGIWRSRLNQEVKDNRFSVFFTLSYDNKHVPTFRYSEVHHCFVRAGSSRVFECHPLGTCIEDFNCKDYISSSDVDYVPPITGFDSNDTFAVCSRSDVQKFLKRLRYYVKSSLLRYYRVTYLYKYRSFLSSLGFRPGSDFKYWLDGLDEESYALYDCVSSYFLNEYEEKSKKVDSVLRYFVCAEYGPRTYRPHYHGLLFFDNEEIVKFIKRCIVSAWPLCAPERVDVQFVQGDAAGYVSKYVTGNTDLPEVLRLKPTRTFCLASKNPALGYKSFGFERLQEIFNSGTIFESTFSYSKQGEQTSVYPIPSGVVRRFFPKCKEYSHLSGSAKLRIYTRFVRTKKVDGRIVFDEKASLDTLGVYREFFSFYARYGVDAFGMGYKIGDVDGLFDYSSANVRCAFACLRWCMHFGCPPSHYIFMLDWFHYQFDQYHLYQQLLLEDEIMRSAFSRPGSNYALLQMDNVLLSRLPHSISEATIDNELISILDSHKISYVWFYDKFGKLDVDMVSSLREINSEHFHRFRSYKYDNILSGNKSKVANEHVLDNLSIV